LVNKEDKPTKFNAVGADSIYCNSYYGPTWGGGYDLYVSNNCNQNASSYSNLGFTYRHPNLVYGSNEATTFLTGSFNFQVEEIEVFQKLE
jgi:hypothetical protein